MKTVECEINPDTLIASIGDRFFSICDEEEIDIFERSPHYANLGTVTHWMELPKQPFEPFGCTATVVGNLCYLNGECYDLNQYIGEE